MCRAFVEEPGGEQVEDGLPDFPQGLEPNYITFDSF